VPSLTDVQKLQKLFEEASDPGAPPPASPLLPQSLIIITTDTVQLAGADPHTVGGLLKRFFRDLPEPIFANELYDKWTAAQCPFPLPEYFLEFLHDAALFSFTHERRADERDGSFTSNLAAHQSPGSPSSLSIPRQTLALLQCQQINKVHSSPLHILLFSFRFLMSLVDLEHCLGCGLAAQLGLVLRPRPQFPRLTQNGCRWNHDGSGGGIDGGPV